MANYLWTSFIANNSSNTVLMCSSLDGLHWMKNTNINQSSKFGASIAMFNNRLYVAFIANNDTNSVLVCSSDNGRNWTNNISINQSSANAPSLAVFNNRLYVAFIDNNPTNTVLVCSSADGVNWSNNTSINQSSPFAPSLAAFNNRLYVTFIANNPSSTVLVCSSADGANWSNNIDINQSSSFAPSLAVAPFANSLNVAAYGEGIMYPPNLAPNLAAIQTAGWTSVILGLFHIDSSGDISFNDTQVVTGGIYVGDPTWPSQVEQLLLGQGSTIITLLASVGGGGVKDFSNIQTIYENNNKSFAGTSLQKNFQAFFSEFPVIPLIDMDVEDNYDRNSFVAFCQMLIQIGFAITFCPYATWETDFWTGSLAILNQSNPGAVKWWNLQCYDGGQGNDPQVWANAISQAIPGFGTTGFIIAGDWSRNLAQPKPDPSTWYWQGDCPPAVQSLMVGFAQELCVGGGFIWTIDQILDYAADQKKKADPAPCGNVGLSNYTAAITNGLS
jgi:hypothetical protein